MKKPIDMTETMNTVFKKIKNMSDEEFSNKLKQYENDEIALILRQIQDEYIILQSSCDSEVDLKK